MKIALRSAIALTLVAGLAPAFGADLLAKKSTAASAPVPSFEAFDPFMVRVRGVGLVPDGTGNVNQNGLGVKVGSSVIPELDLSYFFTKNIAIEAICCVSRNPVKVDTLGTVANTWVFPPTVMAQYHFTNFGSFKPYLGVGVNYTHFFDTKATGALAGSHMHINDSFGVAAQAGFDYMIDRHWGLNADVKRILMQPTWRDTAGLTGKAKINPWLFGLGVTYRFGGPEGAVAAKY